MLAWLYTNSGYVFSKTYDLLSFLDSSFESGFDTSLCLTSRANLYTLNKIFLSFWKNPFLYTVSTFTHPSPPQIYPSSSTSWLIPTCCHLVSMVNIHYIFQIFAQSHQSLERKSFLAVTLWTSGRNFRYSRINALPGRNAFEVFSGEVLTQVCSLSIYVKMEQPPDPTVRTIQFIQITAWILPQI